MNTLNHLADASLDASFVPEVSDVLAALANNDTCFFGGDNSAKGQLSLGVLFVRLRGRFAVRAETIFHAKLIHGVEEIAAVGREGILRSRHLDRFGLGVGVGEAGR